MNHFVVDQLCFVRGQTINYVRDLNDLDTEIIPTGLKNHIKWNLGHMYVVGEKFAFQLTGEETQYPAHFNTLFDPGTQPSDWDLELPTLAQITELLTKQMERIESVLSGRLNEEIHPPYKSSTGITVTHVKQLLAFLIYHEAMHFATIKNIKSITKS